MRIGTVNMQVKATTGAIQCRNELVVCGTTSCL